MVFSKSDRRLTLFQHSLCGGIAGVTARCATAPLDVIKVRTQVGTYDTRAGIRYTFHSLLRDGGLKVFWRGNLLGCLRIVPFSFVHLIAFHRLKIILSDSCGRFQPKTALLAGGGAGLIANLVMYPTDTIKTRLIAQSLKNPSYRGIFHVCKKMFSQEGISSFYKGTTASMLGTIPFTTAMFFTYESLEEFYQTHEIRRTSTFEFMNGCIAALVAQTAAFPFDTIRKKMQAYSGVLPNKGNVDITLRGVTEGFRQIIGFHGVRGLWRGAFANSLRVVPYSGVMFVSYETCKKCCLFYNGYTMSPLPHILDPNPNIDQSLNPEELDDFFEEVHFSGSPWDDNDQEG